MSAKTIRPATGKLGILTPHFLANCAGKFESADPFAQVFCIFFCFAGLGLIYNHINRFFDSTVILLIERFCQLSIDLFSQFAIFFQALQFCR